MSFADKATIVWYVKAKFHKHIIYRGGSRTDIMGGPSQRFAHTQLHSARARAITDLVNGEGLGSEASITSVEWMGYPAQRC